MVTVLFRFASASRSSLSHCDGVTFKIETISVLQVEQSLLSLLAT